jgi:methyl-accepting chemotaxis protein
MLRVVQNLRIGTKLAITAGLSILLICALIYNQHSGGSAVADGFKTALRQQGAAQVAADVAAKIGVMQVGVRDTLAATTKQELQAAADAYNANMAGAMSYLNELAKMAKLKENIERMDKIKVAVAALTSGRLELAKFREQIIALEAKKASAAASASEIDAQIAKQLAEIDQYRHTVTLPLITELDAMTTAIVESGKATSQQSIAAADARFSEVETTGLIVGGIAALLLIGTCVFSIATVAKPVQALARSMLELADGNFDVVLPGLGRKDEIGEVADAVERFKIKAQQKAAAEAEAQREQEARLDAERKAEMHRLANSFEAAVGEIVHTVSTASTELEASANTLTMTSQRSQERTATVAAASEEASTNVQSVASATEEMSSSIGEISRQVQESARIASEAVDQARHTNASVGDLSQAASRIGDVVELINTIAGQTNLLALNATIEAARAGDAGRGFAVVASEVKALAEQTAKATGEISQQIVGIQAATNDSVQAIRKIGETISRMSEISSTIASAVEQQGAATQEISRNVQQAASGTQQVSSNIIEVQHGVSETGSASSQVLSAAQSLSRDSNRLKDEVMRFLDTVRAA